MDSKTSHHIPAASIFVRIGGELASWTLTLSRDEGATSKCQSQMADVRVHRVSLQSTLLFFLPPFLLSHPAALSVFRIACLSMEGRGWPGPARGGAKPIANCRWTAQSRASSTGREITPQIVSCSAASSLETSEGVHYRPQVPNLQILRSSICPTRSGPTGRTNCFQRQGLLLR